MAVDDLGAELPPVDRSGPDLVYMVMADFIAGQIEHGRRAPASRLPSELDMANMWGVARMTVRRAIQELAEERGLVQTIHGKGTFVTSPSRWGNQKSNG
ncbi:hypothetical protein GCM10009555_023440 [Acrocarpospora macrocephala]|uniref:HTH gntR-type domain-containing protein n=1 Tax=Acrocarpospora macrocephala TaxID=150177 RepID=A0A5M3WUS2_9ACTN|nr:GntR family transcriptional regulator [Acrocarpospora macrocephala]GES12276.1 hypothetical protein Amac_058730 [Acrocarpospora macrocephala]